MKLWTDAIDGKGYFDPRYTCDLDNSSPELRWEAPDSGIEGFALVAEDLTGAHDGQGFALWVIYNIPRRLQHLPAGIPPQDTLPNGIRQGLNGYGKLGYAGPCPARADSPHRYRFRLLALRELPDLPPRLTRERLVEAITPQIVAQAEITGLYQRVLIERAG